MSNTSLSSVEELCETQSSFSSEKTIHVDNNKVAGFADERKEKLQRSEKQVTQILKGLQASTFPEDNFTSANGKPNSPTEVQAELPLKTTNVLKQKINEDQCKSTNESPSITEEVSGLQWELQKKKKLFPVISTTSKKVPTKFTEGLSNTKPEFPNEKCKSDDKAVAKKRLQRELVELMKHPRPLISANLKGDNNLLEWEATIEGPPDSPYEGGKFLLDLSFPERYPFRPPEVTFKTKIYHCNINSKGEISLNFLNMNNWASSYTVATVLLSIQSFLTDCNPHDPLVPAIAAQYINNPELYNETCKEWTKKYASG